MTILSNALWFLILLPLLFFGAEIFLCIRFPKFALIPPIAAATLFFILGFYALILAAILVGIYFVIRHIRKEKQARLSEMERMNIQDL